MRERELIVAGAFIRINTVFIYYSLYTLPSLLLQLLFVWTYHPMFANIFLHTSGSYPRY